MGFPSSSSSLFPVTITFLILLLNLLLTSPVPLPSPQTSLLSPDDPPTVLNCLSKLWEIDPDKTPIDSFCHSHTNATSFCTKVLTSTIKFCRTPESQKIVKNLGLVANSRNTLGVDVCERNKFRGQLLREIGYDNCELFCEAHKTLDKLDASCMAILKFGKLTLGEKYPKLSQGQDKVEGVQQKLVEEGVEVNEIKVKKSRQRKSEIDEEEAPDAEKGNDIKDVAKTKKSDDEIKLDDDKVPDELDSKSNPQSTNSKKKSLIISSVNKKLEEEPNADADPEPEPKTQPKQQKSINRADVHDLNEGQNPDQQQHVKPEPSEDDNQNDEKPTSAPINEDKETETEDETKPLKSYKSPRLSELIGKEKPATTTTTPRSEPEIEKQVPVPKIMETKDDTDTVGDDEPKPKNRAKKVEEEQSDDLDPANPDDPIKIKPKSKAELDEALKDIEIEKNPDLIEESPKIKSDGNDQNPKPNQSDDLDPGNLNDQIKTKPKPKPELDETLKDTEIEKNPDGIEESPKMKSDGNGPRNPKPNQLSDSDGFGNEDIPGEEGEVEDKAGDDDKTYKAPKKLSSSSKMQPLRNRKQPYDNDPSISADLFEDDGFHTSTTPPTSSNTMFTIFLFICCIMFAIVLFKKRLIAFFIEGRPRSRSRGRPGSITTRSRNNSGNGINYSKLDNQYD